MRSQAVEGLTTTFALWQLHLDQELVFDGDTGTTTPLRASDRYGIEWSNNYRVNAWLTLDADYAWSHGRLLGLDPNTPGQYIPEAVTTVFSGGPTVRLPSGWFSELRFRYVGPHPLIEDASGVSRATNLFELNTGYECKRYTCGVEFLNLFNSNGNDIYYYYGTALKTDPGFPFPPGSNGVNDLNIKRLAPFEGAGLLHDEVVRGLIQIKMNRLDDFRLDADAVAGGRDEFLHFRPTEGGVIEEGMTATLLQTSFEDFAFGGNPQPDHRGPFQPLFDGLGRVGGPADALDHADARDAARRPAAGGGRPGKEMGAARGAGKRTRPARRANRA